jgi:cytochrome P450
MTATMMAPAPPRSTVPYLRLLRDVPKLTGVYEEIRDTTGPVTTISLGPERLVAPFVVVTSPETAQQVLGDRQGLFDKDSLLFREGRRVFGSNVFNMRHEDWKPRRRVLQPLFTRAHVALYATHMAQAADAFVDQWAAGDGEVDLDHELRRLTLSVLGRTLFGRPLDAEADRLGPHVARSIRYVKNRSFLPFRAPAWLPSYPRRRAEASLDLLRDLVVDAVRQRAGSAEGSGELIDLLLTATDPESGESLTQQDIVDELLIFLIAGHDTTATVLTSALWFLGHDLAIQRRVAAEAASIGDEVTMADLPRLQETAQVLQEAMRLYPPAAWLPPRRATRDTTLGGFHIAVGTDVVVSAWALHRDPTLWPDPTTFDPDRFRQERVKARDRWAYLPFGGGPRSCIGEHFAMAEATIALSSIVRRIEVISLRSDFPLSVPFTLTAKGPIPARIRVR